VGVSRASETEPSADATPDEILMAAYQAGNEAAFRELFDRYSGSVYGFLVRRLGDRALADDLYQEVFLRLHRARAAYDSQRPFRAWLFTIVHHLLTDTFRARARAPDTKPVDETLARHGDERSPERIAVARQQTDTLGKAIQSLSADEATVLILARLEGLSYEDIGAIVGRSAAATKQLAYRALKRVRAQMTASGHEETS
jgi:RNA polymerase sigma factor (sigma-70 family)